MNGFLLFSHGSLLCGAGEALDEHAERLRTRLGAPVEVGYLNYSEPPVELGVARLAEAGATRIVVIPYFLVPGYFVSKSLPDRLATVAERHSGVEFRIADAIGTHESLADALIESARSAHSSSDDWRDGYAAAAARCRNRPDCPLYGTAHCPATGGLILSLRDIPPGVEGKPGAGGATGKLGPALLVMVHGSPHRSANNSMFDVVEIVRARDFYPIVEVGFMECNEPSIPDAIARCVAAGASKIIAVPYFLHLGTHVVDDLPSLLEEGRIKYPDVEFEFGQYLGRSPRVTDVLAERANAVL